MLTALRYGLVVLATVVLCAGAVSLNGSEARADDSKEAPEERVVFVLDELASDLESAGEECDRVAASLRAWTARHDVELPALVQQTDARHSSLDAAVAKRFDAAIATSMETIFTAAMLCSEHAETNTALDELDALLHGERQEQSAGQ